MNKIILRIILIALFSLPAAAGQVVNITQNPTGDVYGNASDVNNPYDRLGDPNNNTLNLNTDNLLFYKIVFYGASSSSATGNLSGNTINITGTGFQIYVLMGAFASTSGNMSNNTVFISESTNSFYGIITGALNNGDGRVNNNKVDIRSGIISVVSGGLGSKGVVDSNSVYLSNVAGSSGFAISGGGGGGKVLNNIVEIKNSSFMGLEGDLSISGGYDLFKTYDCSANCEISGNSVSLENTIVNEGYIYGGGNRYDSDSKYLIKNNTVNINGGSIGGEIYGGYVGSGGGDVINNTINIYNNPDLSRVYLYGGYSSNGVVSGNTLNLYTNTKVYLVSGFQNYNFYTDGKNLEIPMLKTTGLTLINMNNTVVGLYLKDGSQALKGGDTIYLVSNITGNNISQASGIIRSGATMLYDWDLLVDGRNLYAKIKGDVDTGKPAPCIGEDCGSGGGNNGGDNDGAGRLNPETKSLAEGYLSGMSLLITGGDLANEGSSILDSTLQNDGDGMFSSISANSIKLNSGSYVDTKSGSLIVGFGSKVDNILLGYFLEAGGGKYNTYNEFTDIDSVVKGEGSNTYAGGGLLGRLSFDSIYFDALIRGGYISTDYKADYSPDANYNIGELYYGGQFGVGLIQRMDSFSLNEYIKYLAAMRQGNTIKLDSGEEIQFANVMSSRAVAGVRAKYTAVYVGYAYEQELAGEAKSTTSKQTIDAPTIKGGTSVIEAGYDQTFSHKSIQYGYGRNTRYSPASSLNIGFGGKYYIGQREGFSVNAKLGYMF
ncbi:MAG: hypothetical protein FWE18_04850 [Alphaproteobacteria bacterium]|nr:hypothetical protein [Alphaproteobacteria bacterium]